jgi:hypothetical protein
MAPSPLRHGRVLVAALALAGCGRAPLPAGSPGTGGSAGLGGAAGATIAGAADGSVSGTAAADGGDSFDEVGNQPTPGVDPGRVSIHRLNNTEYDNTIRDLLGVDGHLARQTFQPDEEGEFDNDADAFTINDARYEQYFDAAETLTGQVFADAALRARLVTCTPADAADAACPRAIISAFGARAWRRPLTAAEVDGLVDLQRASAAEGLGFDESLQRVVRAMLSSVPFLYRLELDADPTSLAPHELSGYELATRLSYLLWSSMPDARLFELAGSGALSRSDVLLSEVDRLLGDPRADAFVESFSGQWLGARTLASHQVEPTAFPQFTEPLRADMIGELHLYFGEFLFKDRNFAGFLTDDLNFVDARLAAHYGFPTTGLGTDLVRVENTSDRRKGYLGLAGWLTLTSYSYRTSPTIRGMWLLRQLLCSPPPPPPGVIPKLDPGPTDPQPQTLRQRVEAISNDPTCAACHKLIDPMGLALEEFDGIGAFHTKYDDGTAVDPNVVLIDGTKISGEQDLADWLARDPRFLGCATHNLMTYALSRSLRPEDQPNVDKVRAAWNGQGFTLRALLKDIVLNDTFRFRRGETNP